MLRKQDLADDPIERRLLEQRIGLSPQAPDLDAPHHFLEVYKDPAAVSLEHEAASGAVDAHAAVGADHWVVWSVADCSEGSCLYRVFSGEFYVIPIESP